MKIKEPKESRRREGKCPDFILRRRPLEPWRIVWALREKRHPVVHMPSPCSLERHRLECPQESEKTD